MQTLKEMFGLAAAVIESIGVFIIIAGCTIAIVWFVDRLRRVGAAEAYGAFRRSLGKSIILGLEFLIAGDIIRTVAVSHTLESVAVLGVIVLIRAFLSVTLEFGIEGHWPWRPAGRSKS